jgi:hypothetical protein
MLLSFGKGEQSDAFNSKIASNSHKIVLSKWEYFHISSVLKITTKRNLYLIDNNELAEFNQRAIARTKIRLSDRITEQDIEKIGHKELDLLRYNESDLMSDFLIKEPIGKPEARETLGYNPLGIGYTFKNQWIISILIFSIVFPFVILPIAKMAFGIKDNTATTQEQTQSVDDNIIIADSVIEYFVFTNKEAILNCYSLSKLTPQPESDLIVKMVKRTILDKKDYSAYKDENDSRKAIVSLSNKKCKISYTIGKPTNNGDYLENPELIKNVK